MGLYAFDGTLNDSSGPESERDIIEDTNVHRFRQLYSGHVAYIDGVGTRYGFVGKAIGGAFGAGVGKRVKEQFKTLIKQFEQGDTVIDIVGYSRGAAIARIFLHHLKDNFEEIIKDGISLSSPPEVRFLGLFDTVASLGIPWSENESGFDKEIPDFVRNVFHAMALDESRDTFGIERCLGNRNNITEVWFRGGHGDIGGNASYAIGDDKLSNTRRSNISLSWMLDKANACDLPISKSTKSEEINVDAPVTDKGGKKFSIHNIGNEGSLSRIIHLGDLVHHTIENTELTYGLNGRQLRRIDTVTRIEDQYMQLSAESADWIPSPNHLAEPDNSVFESERPSIAQLSTRRYPFDVLPARSWQSWFDLWGIKDPGVDCNRQGHFWASTASDRALAWEIYVELQTRITVQSLKDDEGDDLTAFKSIYLLFPITRECLRKHGVGCANAGTLITVYLNEKIRTFTAKWHKISEEDKWKDELGVIHQDFRNDLRSIQPDLKALAEALAHLADARLD